MDKVQEQADLIEKRISPYVPSKPTNSSGLGGQKTTGGSNTTQPPSTSPPSPVNGSQSSPPPVTVSPPPANTTPPQPPPSSPPPSITPPPSPPSPPQTQPPPQSTPSGGSPVVNPSPNPQLPLPSIPNIPSLPPPTLVQETLPNDDVQPQPNTPISPPSPPFTPFSPPSQDNSGNQGSPTFSSPSPPGIPVNPNSPRNPSQPFDSPPVEGSNRVPSPSSSSPSPPSFSGSNNNAGGNGGNEQHSNESNNVQKTMIGIGIAGVVVVVFIAVIYFARRRNKKSSSPRSNQQFLPPSNVSVNTDLVLDAEGLMHYSQKTGNMNNSAQNSSPGTSLGNPKPTRTTPDQAVIGTSKTLFTYEELSQITEGFSNKYIIGEGGFGCVYKGVLSEGKPIAIKHLKSVSAEGYREFKAEVEIISRVHHRHLVSLVGYCISEQHRFLIYEFVPNNTLDYHLHGKDLPVLEWSRRVKIALGAAKGLAYLHEDCHPKIFHRDIKSSNILLDDEFEAQVADFGLARLNDTAHSHISTRVMGTFGYLAPEYASSGKLTDRSDVFSFGVVLLELITGRKPVDTSQPLGEESLVEWARPLLIEAIEKRDISEVVDPRLEKQYVEAEVFRMIETAASCVRHSALKRPRMVQVVRALDTRDDMSDLTNGVKVGQSTVYNSGQYSTEILFFRRASEDSSDVGCYTSQEYTGNESERALNSSHRNY